MIDKSSYKNSPKFGNFLIEEHFLCELFRKAFTLLQITRRTMVVYLLKNHFLLFKWRTLPRFTPRNTLCVSEPLSKDKESRIGVFLKQISAAAVWGKVLAPTLVSFCSKKCIKWSSILLSQFFCQNGSP